MKSTVAVRLAVLHRRPLLGDGATPEVGSLALPERPLLHDGWFRPREHRPPGAVTVTYVGHVGAERA